MSARDVISFELDGKAVEAIPGESILQVAKRSGVEIPHLCFKEGMRADGNCRACVVEIEGERVLAPSCCRAPSEGMKVKAQSERAIKSQKMVLEMLLADMPDVGYKWNDASSAGHALGQGQIMAEASVGSGRLEAAGQHGELSEWASAMGVHVRPELKALRREQPKADLSHPAMAVNLDACIQCTRCVRACREVQVNDVIGYAQRGSHSQIVFDQFDAMGESSCVACGECVQACPTGALMPKSQIGSQKVDKKIDSVCPYCGVGCLITYNVKDDKIVSVEGRQGPANDSRLCVKGRFGFDYVHHDGRLTQPLIRKPGVPKTILPRDAFENGGWREVFREATWEEALDLAGGKLKALRDQHGAKSLAGFGSAKGSNEEAYLFQKLVRTGFGSNNVDHCTRLCHASSVAALLEGVGSGAVSNQVKDVEHSEVILIIGSNPTSNHPVAATWMKNAAQLGSKIILADPRRTDIARHAWKSLQFKPDTDVLLLNAMLYTIIEKGLVAREFIAQRATNFEALKAQVANFSPEAVEHACGIDAATIREVATTFATAKSAMILWGMGVSQHVHGTDNARCLIALVTITGQLGRPGTGLHPLRGQNNVQGASDAGLIPMMLPNYQRVDNAAAHAWFENFWDTKLDSKPGYTVVEIMHKVLAEESDPHKIRGMYIMGENPAMSDPDLAHARHALESLEHLVVQDIFMTETAWLADVVLPASAWPEKTGTVSNTDRMVQLGRQALPLPGNAKHDLWIIQKLAKCLGLHWNYAGADDEAHNHADGSGAAAVYEEMRQAMHTAIAGITWARLQKEGSVTYPCLSEDDPGQPIVFQTNVPTLDGKIKLMPAGFIPADESPDAEYPYVLITGRQLEHWHTGSMTRRASTLDAIEPQATASINSTLAARIKAQAGELIEVSSRRGKIQLQVRIDEGTPANTVFIPFAYAEAAANLLTNAALDPFGKIPEFKYCAVNLGLLAQAH
jgi:formate dehydrogenase major subunit